MSARDLAEAAAQAAAAEEAALRAAADRAEAARVAHEARVAADESARQHAELAAQAHAARTEAETTAADAVAAREAADREAQAHAELAQEAAERRAAAERRTREVLDLAAQESTVHAEELAHAVRARAAAEAAVAEQYRVRIEAEKLIQERAVDRAAVEAAVRHQAELAEEAMRQRAEAEDRARELAQALAETRGLLLDELTTRRRWWQRPDAVVLPPLPATAAEATPRAMTAGATGVDDSRPRGGLLRAAAQPPARRRTRFGLVAIAAVGVAAYGLVGGVSTTFAAVAALVAVALGLLAWRLRPNRSHVRIDHGLVDIVVGDRQHRFDLNNEHTRLDVAGRPGERDWQVQFLRRGQEPVAVDARMVDGDAFTEALRKWRPEL